MKSGALANIRVIDFTNYLAGPYCGMFLADMGAEVIKVENPVEGGDRTRRTWRSENEPPDDMSLYFSNMNRNKKSLAVNLKTPEGKEIFRKLIESADVLLENNRPGVMDRLGFGYEECKKINQRLVYASVSAYGQTGPYRLRPGFDIISQALGGSMAATGFKQTPPTRSGIPVGDVLGGMNCCIGILASLYKRNETGKGQQVDVALVDSIVSSLATITVSYVAEGALAKRMGNRYDVPGPYDSFRAKDKNFIIACGNKKHFDDLAIVIGRPELSEDPRFKDDMDRKKSADLPDYPIKTYIEEWSLQRTAEECVDIINEAGVPASLIYDYDEIFHDEQIAGAREMFVKTKHPLYEGKEILVTANPIKMSDYPAEVRTPPPILGEHTDVVLTELGFTQDQIDSMKNHDVIK